jgi:hypothetical protein
MAQKRRIERQILIGMIISDDFLRQIHELWTPKLMKTKLSKRISKWCVEYYKEYGQAPKQDMETIYIDKLKAEKLQDAEAELIEDLLADLSDEYDRRKLNVKYLLTKTKEYFIERGLEEHHSEIRQLLENGDVEEANALASKYSTPVETAANVLDFSNKKQVFERLTELFSEKTEPLFPYPGAAGQMINEFLLRESFIAFLAPEKRGKSITLLDLAMRAVRHGCNVAYFQAGDMSELNQLRRIAINRTGKNTSEKYMGKQWLPVKDCILNQLDLCTEKERECTFGIFEDGEIESRDDVTKELLLQKSKDYPGYEPCTNCLKFRKNKWGTPWFVEKDLGSELTEPEAKKAFEKFFFKKKRRFQLYTYPNKTLTVKEMERRLDQSEKEDGFVADVIILDYADIVVAPHIRDFRHEQDNIWANLRGLAQKRFALLATATQGDAKSNKSNILTVDNFSEDKRKIGHVTALFGLNRDPEGREARLKMIRLNKIVAREGDADPYETVTVLQSLGQSIFLLTSFL